MNKEALMAFATNYTSSPANRFQTDAHQDAFTKAKLWTVPVGRFFFSLIFIMAGFSHFSQSTIAYAQSQNVPMAAFLVPLSGVMSIIGGASILLGYKARFGALLIILFLIPVTFSMHTFWNETNAVQMQNQMAHFMKNISMLGASLLIFFYGSGPKSIDRHR
jgi:putative oxidoreductase